MRGIVAGLEAPQGISYFSRVSAELLSGCASMAAAAGDLPAAREYLSEVREKAERFDAAPRYDLCETGFFFGDTGATAFDDFGKTAMEGVRSILAEQPAASEELLRIWEELQHE